MKEVAEADTGAERDGIKEVRDVETAHTDWVKAGKWSEEREGGETGSRREVTEEALEKGECED
jgi:hypothetical protein